MALPDLEALNAALDLLPDQFRGPGGVAGVVHEGRVIARRAWGHADVAARLPMTSTRRMPICSISKQMTCALLMDQCGSPEVLNPLLPDLLPKLQGPRPTVAQLCHNQSGLRDYWALTVLHGAAPEGRLTAEQGLELISGARSTHFHPGTAYSYSNGNYRLLAELIQRATGKAFGPLLTERILRPAGMTTAELSPDTSQQVDGVIGYEGNDDVGFLPAESAITWIGDAGVVASLEDMLAWEVWIDTTRNDPAGLYSRLSAPVIFADGAPAAYAYGLRRYELAGQVVTGHGGGLRGFCSFRLHVAAARLSVVVIFNHEASAMGAAEGLMQAALGLPIPPSLPAEGWTGLWYEPQTDLFLRCRDTPDGVRLNFSVSSVTLRPVTPVRAEGPGGLVLEREGAALVMRRPAENLILHALPVRPLARADAAAIAGRYWSDEIGAALLIEARDGAASISFEGMLGAGPVERMYPLAPDLWTVTSRRAMDAAPPGEWSLRICRDALGRVEGLVLGCWLARSIHYCGPLAD